MKICIDLTSLYDKISGIEKFTLMITKNMINNNLYDNKYILVFWNEVHKDFEEIIKKENIDYKIIKSKNKIIMSQVLLPLKLYSIKADNYVFMAFPSPILFRNDKIVNTIHDMTPWLYPETMSIKGLILFRMLILNAIKISNKIITVSNTSKNEIMKKFNKANNIEVIYNGVDNVFTNFSYNEETARFIKSKYNTSDDYILSLGTLEPRKNFKLLLEAFVELKRDGKISSKLVIVGRKGWKYNDLFINIEDDILKNIIFTGFVDTEDLPYIYKEARFFVFPSLYEGFGIPLIEASSMECIVLASDIKVSIEVLSDKAIFFKSNDKDSLKDIILEVLEYSEDKKKLIRRKLKENSKNYNWEVEAVNLLNIINKL